MKSEPWAEGDPNSPICLVGEAPSIQEMKEGRPFVGPAGQVLDRCLVAAGIDRGRCYIVNTFQGQTRKDQDGSAWGVGGKLWAPDKGLTEAGQTAAQPARELLRLARPNVLVPLGAIALSFLCPSTKGQIGKWRGSILEAEGRKVVPTYHPATVVWGSTHLQHVIATDLERVKEQSAFAELRRRPRELVLNPSYAEVLGHLNELRRRKRRTFFDLELFGGQLSAISFSNDPEWSISIPFITAERRHRWSDREELHILSDIAELLANPEIPKGNQNVTFDCHILAKLYGMLTHGRLDDPMVLHSIALPDLEKSLAFQCSWLTDVPYYKDDGGKRAWENPFRNIEAFWRYSALDACVSLECFESLKAQFLGEGSPFRRTYEETMELVHPITFMMLRGQRLDRKGMRKERDRVRSELEALREKLRLAHPELGPQKLPKGKPIGFNPDSPKQCQELFYGKLGFEPYTSKGRITTDVFALRRLARRGCWEAKAVLQCRGMAKQLTYFEVPTSDGRFYTAYNIRGAKTGRLSAEENELGDGRNGQNLTSTMKTFLLSDEMEGECDDQG